MSPCIRSRTCRWNSRPVRDRRGARTRRSRGRLRSVAAARLDTLPQRRASARRRCAGRRSSSALRPDLRIGGSARQCQHAPEKTRCRRLRRDHSGLRRLGPARTLRAHPQPLVRRPGCRRQRRAPSPSKQRVGDARAAALLAPLNDADTARCVAAERELTRQLQGSCQVPIAAFCIETEHGLHLSGLVGDAVSGKLVRAESEGARNAPEALGREVAGRLLALGAGALLGR